MWTGSSGTGVVKITHPPDFNDFQVGNRHQLERVDLLNPDGTLNANAGPYQGMDRFEARKKIVADLVAGRAGRLRRLGRLLRPAGAIGPLGVAAFMASAG